MFENVCVHSCSCSSTIALTYVTKDACVANNLNWDDLGFCQCYENARNYDETECVGRALVYSAPYFRFDTVFESMFAVFLISRGAQWDYFLYDTFKTAVENVWDYDNITTLIGAVCYYLCVVLIGQYFITSLVVATVISSYNRWHHEENKLLLNISVHKSLQRISQFLTTFRKKHCRLPPLPDNLIAQYCLNFVDSLRYKFFIFGCIALNMVVLALQSYPENRCVC